MPIVINLDMMLVRRKIRSKELANFTGLTEQTISAMKNGKVKAVRLSTLESLCDILDCQPGDLLEFIRKDEEDNGK